MPSYLIAIAVGLLKSKDIGPRSKVWSEESMVQDAATEFAEVWLVFSFLLFHCFRVYLPQHVTL